MLASHICAGKSSCFKFACFCEWYVEIWLFSYFTGAVMYCVPQGRKSTKLSVTDHALLKERSLTLKRKALSMFDSPAPSHTGINLVPVRSWLSHRASERPWTPLTSLEQNQLYPLCAKSGRCQCVPRCPGDEVGLYPTAPLAQPAASGVARAETASVLLQLRELGSKLWTQYLNMCVPKHPSPSTLSFCSTPAVGIKGNWKHIEFTGTHHYLPHCTVGSALLLTLHVQPCDRYVWLSFLMKTSPYTKKL